MVLPWGKVTYPTEQSFLESQLGSITHLEVQGKNMGLQPELGKEPYDYVQIHTGQLYIYNYIYICISISICNDMSMYIYTYMYMYMYMYIYM